MPLHEPSRRPDGAADRTTSASTLPVAAAERPPTPTMPRNGVVVFSGGTAANSLVDVFDHVRETNHTTLSYVIPVSDNGGSSSELIRVFGGPGKS